MMKVFFFGCIGRPGHGLHGEGSRMWPFNKCIPWGFELDSKLCPDGKEQLQSHAAIHHKEGWTALAWWDRSGPDKRMGCNSALLAEGEFTFAEMETLMKDHWAEVFERQPVELFLEIA